MPNEHKPNPQEPVICLLDRTETTVDFGKQYMNIIGLDGATHKVSEKRQDVWGKVKNLPRYTALLIIYESFTKADNKTGKPTTIDYVADVQLIADKLTEKAVSKLAQKLIDGANEDRNRSTALSYAKDLITSADFFKGVDALDILTPLKVMYEIAQRNYAFIKGVNAGE